MAAERKSVNNSKEISRLGANALLYCDWCEDKFGSRWVRETENGEWVCNNCLSDNLDKKEEKERKIANTNLQEKIKELKAVEEKLEWESEIILGYYGKKTYQGLDLKKLE